MDKERKKDAWRDFHESVMITVPFYEELKAEAEVCGCCIGEVIESKLDTFRHLMMTPEELGRHFKKDHPDLIREPDLDRDFQEYLAQIEYTKKVEVVLEKNRKNMLASKAIARRKAIEKRRVQAEVGQ